MHELKSNEEFSEEICRRHFNQVYKYCKNLLKGQPDDLAEECTQNTFLQAHTQASKLKVHPNIVGWLYTTSRNQVNAAYRKQYRKRKYEFILSGELSSKLVSDNRELDEILISILNIDSLVETVLSKLNNFEAKLYTEYFKNQLSISQLAEKYNLSQTAITTRIYRLKRKIRAIAHYTLSA
ncbi:RNA polymerase sigma factor [Paenibacillus sp. 32352]|uniref:RNA polymerase sigma factor n=1 Tax=Paenibacillus sp. 32352 TaxID=1969111 RepID=UPI0009AC1AA2|nr:sigma-70 family RNA polymerase sigma factor [Paenibacillus sp. 32352]